MDIPLPACCLPAPPRICNAAAFARFTRSGWVDYHHHRLRYCWILRDMPPHGAFCHTAHSAPPAFAGCHHVDSHHTPHRTAPHCASCLRCAHLHLFAATPVVGGLLRTCPTFTFYHPHTTPHLPGCWVGGGWVDWCIATTLATLLVVPWIPLLPPGSPPPGYHLFHFATTYHLLLLFVHWILLFYHRSWICLHCYYIRSPLFFFPWVTIPLCTISYHSYPCISRTTTTWFCSLHTCSFSQLLPNLLPPAHYTVQVLPPTHTLGSWILWFCIRSYTCSFPSTFWVLWVLFTFVCLLVSDHSITFIPHTLPSVLPFDGSEGR